MTAFELNNCVTTILARDLPAPRICIRLWWSPIGPGNFDVEVVLHPVTGWLHDSDLYVEQCDPLSEYWEQHAPINMPGMTFCLCCGDSTHNIDLIEGRRRSELCVRCEPCAMCCNCRCVVQGTAVCMECVETPDELIFLSEKQLRWHGSFAQDNCRCHGPIVGVYY